MESREGEGMVRLQDIHVALDRAEVLASSYEYSEAQDELMTCLSNARGMLRTLGAEATATLERMTTTVESLSDITAGR